MSSRSKLTALAEDFLSHKRSMGYKYETAQFYLRSFIKYALNNNANLTVPDKAIVLSWIDESINCPGSLYNRIAVSREFGKYLVMRGYRDAYIIPPKHGNKLEKHLPYFFNEAEIKVFFQHCDNIKIRKESPGRDLVVPSFFRLLYCCGLRCQEARLLELKQVKLLQGYIDIIQSKGPKSRRIFLGSELTTSLKKYNNSIECIFPNRQYFFPKNPLFPYQKGFASSNFNRLWKKAFPDFNSPVKPRAYDFRHHFAYANLNRWAREGKDVNVMSAYLMRYMGHSTLDSTLYYFHFVPDFYGTYISKTISLEAILPEVPNGE